MANLISKSFDSPDETRAPDKTKMEIVDLDGVKVARITFEPGWRWSECIKPVVGTDSCQARHLGVIVAGRIHITHEDGTEAEAGVGEVYAIAPGHDAWIVGDEPFTAYEFDTAAAANYAKPS